MPIMPTQITCSGINGPIQVNSMQEYEFTAYIEYASGLEPVEVTTVYLSYFCKDMIKGVDFDAPSSVNIPIGDSKATFKIYFKKEIIDTSYELRIETSTENVFDMCSPFVVTVSEEQGLTCGEMFFFDPYFHKTKKVPNPNINKIQPDLTEQKEI